MTDLTILHSPSTLYLPLANETGLLRGPNRRSTLPFVSNPTVTVQMVDTHPPVSPIRVRDDNLLSPPPHTFRSRGSRTRRLSSAPPEPASRKTSSFHSSDASSLHPKSPNSVPGPSRRASALTLTVVPPPTTLCAYVPPITALRSLPFCQSAQNPFGGILAALLSLGHFTRLPCILFAGRLLLPLVFLSINPLRICLH